MWRKSDSDDSYQQAFEGQFTAERHDYIYRKDRKGPPIRVSDLERDEFVAAFNKRIRLTMWCILPLAVSLILLLIFLPSRAHSLAFDMASFGGGAAIATLFMIIERWAWNAPFRELQQRAPEGPPLSKDETQALTFATITYGQLTLPSITGVWLILYMSQKTDVFHGWGLFGLLIGGGLIGYAVIQVIRKWHFTQQHAPEQD